MKDVSKAVMLARPDVQQPAGEGAHANTLYELVARRGRDSGDAAAFTAPGRVPLSYASLLTCVERTVARLRELGVRRTDRVAVVLPNGPEMAVGFVAVAAGATCVPLNPSYRVREFEFSMSDLGVKVVLAWDGLESPVRTAAASVGIPVVNVKPMSNAGAGMFELVDEGRGRVREGFHEELDYAQPSDMALVLHTSGTTARPKIVPLSQGNICSSGKNVAQTLRLIPSDRCLNVMPLFHIHGLVAGIVASVSAGASVICSPGFDGRKFFEWLDECRPTWFTAVPTMHRAILSKASANAEVTRRCPVRFIRSSSAPLSPGTMIELEKVFGCRVIEAYGMTEASHQIASNPLEPLPRKAGSVGIATGAVVGIRDESGEVVGPNELGEVVVRGEGVMAGYETNPAANANSFVDGWFRTGDRGYVDGDGYLFLTGRLKEIINRGGEKISPAEVDEVLSQHPAVSEAVAFASPHPTLGEDVAVAIVVREGRTVAESELRAFAADRLASHKIPQRILYVNEIPKGASGKPQRIALGEMLSNQRGATAAGSVEGPGPAESKGRAVETEVAEVWRGVLKVARIGSQDNFYSLGGDSLAMAEMLTAIEERFKRTVPVERFLEDPTVEMIARLVQVDSSGLSGDAYEEREEGQARDAAVVRDSLLKGVRNRLLQCAALYAPGYKTSRVWLHRMRGVSIGHNVSIGLSSLIETAYPELVWIGDDVTIGMRVIIIAHLRDFTDAARRRLRHTVRIERGAYIGPAVVILPNVTVGEGAVVAAGSVVTGSVPARTLARGNPARAVAICGKTLGGGLSYEDFVRHLRPL